MSAQGPTGREKRFRRSDTACAWSLYLGDTIALGPPMHTSPFFSYSFFILNRFESIFILFYFLEDAALRSLIIAFAQPGIML